MSGLRSDQRDALAEIYRKAHAEKAWPLLDDIQRDLAAKGSTLNVGRVVQDLEHLRSRSRVAHPVCPDRSVRRRTVNIERNDGAYPTPLGRDPASSWRNGRPHRGLRRRR